jgi:hypothetical protein
VFSLRWSFKGRGNGELKNRLPIGIFGGEIFLIRWQDLGQIVPPYFSSLSLKKAKN